MKKSAKPKRLIVFGCLHCGSKAADINDFKQYVDLLEDEDTYGIVLGDNFENAITARGEGMMNDQHLTPDEQIDEVGRIFRPHKEKIIGACTSNHSRRTYKEVGVDLDKRLWRELGVKDGIYRGLQGVVVFGGKKIAFAHGNGRGGDWGDNKRLFAIYPDADIVVTSHKHEMLSKWHGNFRIDSRGRRTKKFVLFARTGGLMDWAPYAQEELYSPQKPGFTVLYFLPNGVVRADTNGVF